LTGSWGLLRGRSAAIRRFDPLLPFRPASESLSRSRSLLYVGVSFELSCTPSRMWRRSFFSQRSIRKGRGMPLLRQKYRNLQEAFSASSVLGRALRSLTPACGRIPFRGFSPPMPFSETNRRGVRFTRLRRVDPAGKPAFPSEVYVEMARPNSHEFRTSRVFPPRGRLGFPRHPFLSFPAGRHAFSTA
jgi:hypothetical protein